MIKLDDLTIKTAGELLSQKQIEAQELTKYFLDRAQKLNKKLNCYITICAENALKEAKRVDEIIAAGQKISPLAGIPIALKDLFTTKGIQTTAGSKVLENYVPVYDATVVSRLKDNLSIIIGKTNQDAWGHGASGENSDFGPTLNPYDFKRVPGGSSSGSAAAVASGTCLAATGTDTGGSIRQPSSFCNLVGLKPTYGRVSRYGIIAMASSLDSIGHITKTVYDNALILNVTAGLDDFDSTASPNPVDDYTKDLEKGVKGLKVGLPREYFDELDSDIKELMLSTVKTLERLGAQVIDVSLPHTNYGVATYYIVQTSEVSSNLARYDGIRFGNRREKFGAEAKRRIILGLKAMKVRRLIRDDFITAFKKVDILICPISPTLPFKLGEKISDPLQMYLSDIFTVNPSLAGVPSLAIPCGFINNLPVGMQIIGPYFSEKLLYQVGYAYEQDTKWYERRPKV
ncbi:MAG: Glutamyl-tRNA(Gln) amidotransferase subunit A [Candidatus Curtissbacteria bacterium GW2011_GWC2_41_21]|nr:MAG: Glutamyl-tRNA(Gln) amidotransferase subunit A [Candidatus Curtissbacteria bacterium GW2011_GWC2_41_21]